MNWKTKQWTSFDFQKRENSNWLKGAKNELNLIEHSGNIEIQEKENKDKYLKKN